MHPPSETRAALGMLRIAAFIALGAAALQFIMSLADAFFGALWTLTGLAWIVSIVIVAGVGLTWGAARRSQLATVGGILLLVWLAAFLPFNLKGLFEDVLDVVFALLRSTGIMLIALAVARERIQGLALAGVIVTGLGALLLVLPPILYRAIGQGSEHIYGLGQLALGAGVLLLALGARAGGRDADRGVSLGKDRPTAEPHAAAGLVAYRNGLVVQLATIGAVFLLSIAGATGARALLVAAAVLGLGGAIAALVLQLIGIVRFRLIARESQASAMARAAFAMLVAQTILSGVLVLFQLIALGDRSLARDMGRGEQEAMMAIAGFVVQWLLLTSFGHAAQWLGASALAARFRVILIVIAVASGLSALAKSPTIDSGAVTLVLMLLAAGGIITAYVLLLPRLRELEAKLR